MPDCARCHRTGKDPCGFGSPNPWVCMTCGGSGAAQPEADRAPGEVDAVARLLEENDVLRRQHREFVDGLTKALNDAGVPAMPSWQDAIDYLVRRAEGDVPEPTGQRREGGSPPAEPVTTYVCTPEPDHVNRRAIHRAILEAGAADPEAVAALDALRSEQGQSRDDTVTEIVRRLRHSDLIVPDEATREIADWIEAQFLGAGRAEGEDRDTENEG